MVEKDKELVYRGVRYTPETVIRKKEHPREMIYRGIRYVRNLTNSFKKKDGNRAKSYRGIKYE